ncbi:hypothetical protein QQX98_007678 [Neonectria punicea]|uniref:Ndc10 domain-containing protein n=1 Tax=Neonectria punicea TaxID=979145 RepID=A0ABR1GXC5_9HYPO
MSGIDDATDEKAQTSLPKMVPFGCVRFAKKEDGSKKKWDYESAMKSLLHEFRWNGLKMCDEGIITEEKQPLSELYTATARVLLDHFYPESPETGRRKLRDDSKDTSEAVFIRQARDAIRNAAIAYYNDGYVTDDGQRKHYLTTIPPRHVILAIRFLNPYGAADDSIAGHLASIGKTHLMEVARRWTNPGMVTRDIQSITTTASNAQNPVTRLAMELGQRIDNLEDYFAGNEHDNIAALSDDLNAKILNDNAAFGQIRETLAGIQVKSEQTNTYLDSTVTRVEALETAQEKSNQVRSDQINEIFNAIKPQIQAQIGALLSITTARETTPVSPSPQFQTNRASLLSGLSGRSNKQTAASESSASATKRPRYF